MNATSDGGNQHERGLRGDPVADRGQEDGTRDKGSSEPIRLLVADATRLLQEPITPSGHNSLVSNAPLIIRDLVAAVEQLLTAQQTEACAWCYRNHGHGHEENCPKHPVGDEGRWEAIRQALETPDLKSDLSRLAAIGVIVNSRTPMTPKEIAHAHELAERFGWERLPSDKDMARRMEESEARADDLHGLVVKLHTDVSVAEAQRDQLRAREAELLEKLRKYDDLAALLVSQGRRPDEKEEEKNDEGNHAR